MRDLNERYRARHGFKLIIALHAAANVEWVRAQFASSLDQDTGTEIARALGQLASVARARLVQRFRAARGSMQMGQA